MCLYPLYFSLTLSHSTENNNLKRLSAQPAQQWTCFSTSLRPPRTHIFTSFSALCFSISSHFPCVDFLLRVFVSTYAVVSCMLRLPCYSPCDAATRTQAQHMHVLSGALQQLDSLHFATIYLEYCEAVVLRSCIHQSNCS